MKDCTRGSGLPNRPRSPHGMADQAVISALAFLHIVSAIAWFGGLVFFVSSVAPGLRKMSTGARIEFSARIGPGIVRFYGISGTLTIVFGLGLLYEAFGGNPSAWPVSIEIGFSLGFLAYLLALVVTVPASRRLDKISQELVKNPNAGPPSGIREELPEARHWCDCNRHPIASGHRFHG
jgi:uncharacterized membrane protein